MGMKIVELRATVSTLNLPAQSSANLCPLCGVKCKGPRTLAEHLYHSHDGPEPEHWLDIDAAAAS